MVTVTVGGVFRGRRYTPRKQKGYGFFGKAMSFIGKHIKPIAARTASAIGKNLLEHGSGFISDLLDGKNAKQAALTHLKSAGKDSARSLLKNVRDAARGGNAADSIGTNDDDGETSSVPPKRARKAPSSRKRKQTGRGFLFA